jgi:Glycosyltransferase family 87
MRDRLLRDGYVILAVVFLALRLFQVPPWDQSVDAYAYWSTRSGTFYDAQTAGTIGAYLYSPAFAQLLAPLTWLPWAVFDTIWTAFNLAIVWWLLGRWSLPSMLFLPIPFEIVSGNVHLMYAAAIVAGFRFAATWVLMFLTKVTPGIGVLWYAVRREWRPSMLAGGMTGAIVLVSFVLDPAAWRAWVDTLAGSSSTPDTVGWYLPVPLLVRLPIAAVVVGIAAWTDRRWLLPAGVVIAMPVLWLNSLAVLAACVPLWHGAAIRSAAPAARYARMGAA